MRRDPQTYVLTTVCFHRRGIFQRTQNADLLIATILRCRDRDRFLLHGFAVMPDHLHVALTRVESIEKAAQLIESGFSFAIRKQSTGEVWQQSYHAHRVLNSRDDENQLACIAHNPLRQNLAAHPHGHTTGISRMDPTPQSLLTTDRSAA